MGAARPLLLWHRGSFATVSERFRRAVRWPSRAREDASVGDRVSLARCGICPHRSCTKQLQLLYIVTASALTACSAISPEHSYIRRAFMRRHAGGQVQTKVGSNGIELTVDSGTTANENSVLLEKVADSSAVMKQLYPFYHTGSELRKEVKKLKASCRYGMLTMRSQREGSVTLDVIHVRRLGAKKGGVSTNRSVPINRIFMIFGEHSRELISPESGLAMLRLLCRDKLGASTLEDNEFEVVLNANPRSRKEVENGQMCLRTNPSGVDLNRNWDEKWTMQTTEELAMPDTNPGPAPFSEPETRILRDLLMSFRPTTFLTVHSGTRGLYMPWAYDTKSLATRNQEVMMNILRELDRDHCECPYGAAGKEVGYACPGTCLDWVFDKLETPYAFAFEIYVGGNDGGALHGRWKDKLAEGGAALLQSGAHLGHDHFKDLFTHHSSDFVHRSMGQRSPSDPNECFKMFNPITEKTYNDTVNNWASAYLKLAAKVSSHQSVAARGSRHRSDET
eukprot:TRINITY_DN51686_c0_g1_i1.p1 TRINITY_DN51686_c0_g1~~TRINITY_DN51686_c0_g1_i1.p1  ORF type:complete len:507 (+),score=49.68 TRINITY_DN51686_c0_g1_i1:149-1669(+)